MTNSHHITLLFIMYRTLFLKMNFMTYFFQLHKFQTKRHKIVHDPQCSKIRKKGGILGSRNVCLLSEEKKFQKKIFKVGNHATSWTGRICLLQYFFLFLEHFVTLSSLYYFSSLSLPVVTVYNFAIFPLINYF